MTIGIDCRLWNETGVGRYIRNLVEQLVKQNSEHRFILFVLKKDVEKIENKNLGKFVKLAVADIRWHSIEEQLLLPEILRKENVDLMHFPYFSVPILYSKPFVVTIHDLILNHYQTGEATTHNPLLYNLKRQGYKYIIQQAANKARAIITVSHATQEEIVDHLRVSKEKIFVTYEGVDEQLKNTNIKKAIQIKKFFLHVGNVYPHKNVDRLLRAFIIFLKTNADVKIVFVGKEDFFFNKLKAKVKLLGLSKSVVFAGLVSDEALVAYYDQAIAVVVPSLMEGFGLPAIEAMAQNCLVLASDIPSLREVCEHVALYFDPLNENDIAKCMEKALQLPIAKKNELMREGKKKITHYSWQEMAQETITIYESCIDI